MNTISIPARHSNPIPLAALPNSNINAPLKLTFRLGGATPQVSTVPSVPVSEDMDVDSQQDNTSEAGSSVLGSQNGESSNNNNNNNNNNSVRLHWDNRGKIPLAAPTPTTTTTVDGEVKPKQRRKRGPKRPPGEAGPGKNWRKGVKGNLAGTGAPPRVNSPNTTPYTYKPQASTSTSGSAVASTSAMLSSGFPIGPAPKLATNYLPPLPLEIKTPRPRSWNRVVKELTSVSGTVLHFTSWRGRSTSAYFDATQAARATAAALQAQVQAKAQEQAQAQAQAQAQVPKTFSTDIPLRSPIPSQSANNSSPAPSLHFSLSPHPLPIPQFAPLLPISDNQAALIDAYRGHPTGNIANEG